MLKNRGQGSMEFVIIVSAMLFIFISFFYAIQTANEGKLKENLNREITETCLNLKNEVDLAHSSSDGYVRNFTIKDTLLNGLNYTIQIVDNDTIYLLTKDERFSNALNVIEVIGQPKKGINVIKKINGQVYLN